MQGKIVGGYLKKCEPGKKWETSATLFVECEFPTGNDVIYSGGQCVRSVVCEGKRLPAPIDKMKGHSYFIGTVNNFANDFFLLDKQ